MIFDESMHIQDILLEIALGHGLRGSQSLLSLLSKDVLQHALASAIEECYWQQRADIGLMTPKPAFRDPAKFMKVPDLIPLPDQIIRRGLKIARPLAHPIGQHFSRMQCSIWKFPIQVEAEDTTPNRAVMRESMCATALERREY